MIQKLLVITTLSFLLISCGSDGLFGEKSSSFEVMTPKSCSQTDKNQFIADVLHDSYFWADDVKNISIASYDSEYEVLDALRYKDDRYSFILTQKEHEDIFITGKSKNFGFMTASSDFPWGIIYVSPNSPAQHAGLVRSDKVVSYHVVQDVNDTKTITFELLNSENQERSITITEAEYQTDNVSQAKILNISDKKIGYFLFQSFTGPNTMDRLQETFKKFKEEGIDELVLDLRYNGGGELQIATYLGSLIGGKNVDGHVFNTSNFNQKYAQHNSRTYFDKIPEESLHFNKIFFIMTEASASASEALITALDARENNMEVVTIGENSYGKPYGMYPISYCDKVLIPIHFNYENSDGYGNFIDGLSPTCKAVDDINHTFGDENESSLKEALFYIQNGHCSR